MKNLIGETTSLVSAPKWILASITIAIALVGLVGSALIGKSDQTDMLHIRDTSDDFRSRAAIARDSVKTTVSDNEKKFSQPRVGANHPFATWDEEVEQVNTELDNQIARSKEL